MPDASLLNSIRASFSASNTISVAQNASVDEDKKLDLLETIFDEIASQRAPVIPDVVPDLNDAVVGVLAQTVPQTTLQAADTLNPQQPMGGSTIKEVLPLNVSSASAVEVGTGLQFVEQEPSPELSPEVESFLERVEDHQEQLPQEIAIADGSTSVSATTHHPSQPVIVLPITPEIEEQGKRKSPLWSIRWLVEWSHRIVKAFTGQVIYRQG
jgi:hypothetical protein